MRETPPFVSVIVPTVNRENVLIDTIRDLLAQDYSPYELLVIDQSDERNRDLIELARHSKTLRYFHSTSFKSLPAARNFGWRHANGEIVLYTDDDIRANADLVREHAKCYGDPRVAMVAGGITEAGQRDRPTLRPGHFNYWTATPTADFHASQPRWVHHARGCNFSVRRSVLEVLGGIDERFTIGAALHEEMDLALRARKRGLGVWFAPSAHLMHLAAPTGGCRVTDWEKYVYGLAHNRSMIISRHCAAWHRPTAWARLGLLALSYSRVARSPRPLRAAVRGVVDGIAHARRPPPLPTAHRAEECTSS